MDKAFFILIIIPFMLVAGATVYTLDTTTAESLKAAGVAKYKISIGMSYYYANSYTQTNGTLTFHDVLRDVDESFIGESFSVKANKE